MFKQIYLTIFNPPPSIPHAVLEGCKHKLFTNHSQKDLLITSIFWLSPYWQRTFIISMEEMPRKTTKLSLYHAWVCINICVRGWLCDR